MGYELPIKRECEFSVKYKLDFTLKRVTNENSDNNENS